MLRKIRTILAAVFIVLITLLFLDFTGTLHHWLGWMAKIQFLPAVMALNVVVAVALIALTLVFGRIYCSVICPLGVFQDILARFHRKKNKYSFSKEVTWLRYPVLAAFVVAAVAGVGSLFQLLAPYSAYGRIATMIFQPIWKAGNNLLAMVAEHYESYAFYSIDTWMRSLPVFVIAAVTLVALLVLAWRGGRTYCNTICPVGTVLSFFARFSWMKIRFDEDKCKNCSLCSKNCKAACIDYKTHTVDYSRCVMCFDCIENCHSHAIQYKFYPKVAKRNGAEPQNGAERRAFITGLALFAGAATIEAKKKNLAEGVAKLEDKQVPPRTTTPVPAGAVSQKNFYSHCTACQLCVSKCPNKVLRPSTRLDRLMQPEMAFDEGFCRIECTRCSEVCPTGAIRLVESPADKSAIQIGHAVVIPENCVVNRDKVNCGNCARHCPVGAITMVKSQDNEKLRVPAVNPEQCIGCGACEFHCPARPVSAIYVEGHEVHKER